MKMRITKVYQFTKEYKYYLIVCFCLLTLIGWVSANNRSQTVAIDLPPLKPILAPMVATATPQSSATIAPTPTNAPIAIATATNEPIAIHYDALPTVLPDGCDPNPCGTIIWVTPVVLRDPALDRPTVESNQHIYGDWRDTDPMYQH
jgi:hypothetical protein